MRGKVLTVPIGADIIAAIMADKNLINASSDLASFDTTIILRPEIRHRDIEFRGISLTAEERRNIRRALYTLHTLEIMAVAIYRCQIGCEQTELNRELIAAMCNEMTHVQDFQVGLYEYGLSPSLFRWAWHLAGCVMGTVSRMLGDKTILKLGIWVESKAVSHYAHLIEAAPWDEAMHKTIQKNREDELGHIQTWRRLLAVLEQN